MLFMFYLNTHFVFLEKSEYAVTVPKLKETPNIM